MSKLTEQVEELEAELAEINQLFCQQHKADQRAIKRWQECHPDRENIWPDRADMVEWMINKVDEQGKEIMSMKSKLNGIMDIVALKEGVDYETVDEATAFADSSITATIRDTFIKGVTDGSENCLCIQCEKDKPEPFQTEIHMALCGVCGNKRCPQATNHIYKCTNSNEPGQPGSIYG